MASEQRFEALHRRISFHIGFVALICDSDLVQLLRLPPDWEDLARFHAEFFVRLWLYGDRCPEKILSATDELPVGSDFRAAFYAKAVPLRRPAADSEQSYIEMLSAPALDGHPKAVWDALKTRLIQFLQCDGIFPLVTPGAEEASVVSFRFTQAIDRRHKVYDSNEREIREWTGLLEALGDSGDFNVGVEIAGEFPEEFIKEENGNKIGWSLGLALILARERRRGTHIGWYWPLDLLTTGAFHEGRLRKVEHVSSKRAAGHRLNARLTVWPEDSEDGIAEVHGDLTLPTNWSAIKCVEAISTRLHERELDKLDFHRACLCVRQLLERKVEDLTDPRELKQILIHLKRCRRVFKDKDSILPAASSEWRRKCDKAMLAAEVQYFWLRGRLAAAIGVFALIVLGFVWQWQDHRNAEVARLGRIESFTEQGRQELLTGSPLRALPFLAEAYREGGTGAGLRLLLAQAINAIDSRVVSFGGPSDAVHYATFSPDGSRLLTASANNTAKVWNTATGESLLTLPEACDRTIRPAFSPDGSLIATARGKIAKLWRTTDGRLHASLIGHRLDVKSVAFSADGARLVTASVDDTANIWDATEGKLLVSTVGHSASVRSAVFSPDGRRVLTVSADETAKVWDATTGALVVTLLLKADGVRPTPSLVHYDCFSPDSSRIVTLSGNQVASVWSSESGKRLAVLRAAKPIFRSVTFTRDGTRALAFSPTDDNKINVWDIESEKVVMTLEGHTGWISAIESNSSGSRYVSASFDATARVWDAVSGKELETLEGHKGFLVTSASYSHDGTHVVTVDGEGYARVWDMTGGKLVSSFQNRSNHIGTLAFGQDGTRIITAGADRSLTIWNAITWRRELLLTNFTYPTVSAAFTHNGNHIIIANGFGGSPLLHDPMVRVLDATTGQPLCSLGPHSNVVTSVGFSSNGRRVLTTTGEAAHLWDATSGNLLGTFIPPPPKAIVAAGFNSDSTRAFIATYGRSGLTDAMLDDGNAVEVWDFETKRLISSFASPNAFFYSVNFTRDGSRILSAGADQIVTVWETRTGKALNSLHANIPFGGLFRFNKDGSLILTTDANTAKIWETASGRLLLRLEGHTSGITFASFSGDDSRVATASESAIKIWSVNLETRRPEEIVRLIEARVPWRLANGQLIPAINVEH